MTDYQQEVLQDVAAERAVLAGIFQYGGDAYVDSAELLGTTSFTVGSNQTIWECLDHLLKDNPTAVVDFPTFMSAAKTLGYAELFAKENELKHLRAVMSFPVMRENVRKLAGRVRKLEVARMLHSQLGAAQDNLAKVTGEEPIDSILGMAEEPIFEFTAGLMQSTEGPQHIGQGVREYAKYLAENQRETVGISTGYKLYDKSIGGGLRPGTVNVIGARPKTGKTLLGMNIGLYIAGALDKFWDTYQVGPDRNILNATKVETLPSPGLPVLYLDTEMTKKDQWNRILARLSGVTIDEIEKGIYANSPAKLRAVERAIDILENSPYDFLSIAGQPFEETEAVMRRWVTKRVGLQDNGEAKPCVLIFDYLKLMSSESMENKNLAEFQVLGFMMTRLHNFAVRYKVPVLSFIQLNRDGITREDTDVASGSDRIIWLCSNFAIYKKKSDEEMAEQVGQKQTYNRKLITLVARHGAGLDDGDYIHMQSHGAIAKIVEGPLRSQMKTDGESGQPKGMIVDGNPQDDVPFAA